MTACAFSVQVTATSFPATLGLVLLAVDTVDAGESDRHGRRAWRPS
jgi:hypothetical protein